FENSAGAEQRFLVDEFLFGILQKRLGCSVQQASAVHVRVDNIVPGWQNWIFWALGEPEVSQRANRLLVAHCLKTCDLPRPQQPPVLPGSFQLRNTPDRTAGLTAQELNRKLECCLLAYSVGTLSDPSRVWEEAARQTLLETELSLQILIR